MNVLKYLEHSAEAYPEKTALSYRDNTLSFSTLLAKCAEYAFIIKKIEHEECKAVPIGVIVRRNVDSIVHFLSVVYSGNFYIPIDPEAPVEKIKAILEDSKVSILIGDGDSKSLIDTLEFSGEFISNCDLTFERLEAPIQKEENPPLYMVYTSGSTGKPKGVLKSHKAEISFIEAYCETFEFTSDDIIGNQTPFFFDAAAKDIYLMLKMGITMEIIPTEYFPLPTELVDYLNKKRITFASWVPTVLSIVAQLNPFSLVKPTTLKKVFFVGEVMPMKHLNLWRKELPDLQYVNLYGQSELCGICCYYNVVDEFANDESLPMGVPLKNCEIYLMDGDQVITESGKIGEMYVVSDALATEYYNDPEKTLKSFVYKDFGNGNVRCFKTGDLAQYDKEGNLIFAARTDFQIKHMGHRIELGEIETIAGALPEIARCCCLYNNEKKKIVLFCELAKDSVSTAISIKSTLKTRLSSYMVPGKVVIMDNLPLNANGKIDRQKLKLLLKEGK